jgi:SNF2 family DNA or RNA helicase
MLVFHAHWQPPFSPADTGGMLFWAETSDAPPPPRLPGRPVKHPRAKDHPFCAPPSALAPLFSPDGWGENGGDGGHPVVTGARPGQATLLLPTTRSGPQPSPDLVHDWELDEKTPVLMPWRVTGVWLPAASAIQLLVGLPLPEDLPPHMVLAADVRYWRTAAMLVLETLAGQKLVPVLVPADATGRTLRAEPQGEAFHARWLAILDGPKDAPRLARLVAAMPPICRAEAPPQGDRTDGTPRPPQAAPTPRTLLDLFIKTMADALARRWGRATVAAARRPVDSDPAQRWLAALFSDDPTVDASPAQLQALAHSHRAWMRNLQVAGDAAFRIAFRLEAPLQQVSALTPGPSPRGRGEGGEGGGGDWQLHYLLQARDDPSLLVPAQVVWQTRGTVLKQLGRRFEQPQEKLLAGLGYAARLFPPVTGSLKSARPTQLALDTPQAYTFLREAAPLLEGAGFGVLVPPWWNKPGARLGVRLRLRPTRGPGADVIPKGQLTLENLVHYQWELALGDTMLTRAEFAALAALKSPLVQIRGQWVQLDAEQIEAAIRFWEKQPEGEISLPEAVRLGLGAETTSGGLPVEDVAAEDWLRDWLDRLTRRDRLTELAQPASLQGNLRPYQRYGYSWLHFLRRWGLGACLADDMGLGKTIQTLALLLREKEERGHLPAPTLLVCPTSVVTNWEREVRRFAPALTTLLHQGPNRRRGEDFAQAVQAVDMVLTSYAIVRRDAETIQAISWLGVVLDEAQNIKNPTAQQTQAVRKLAADFRLALTGTPVENRLSELWSIIHFLNPGYLGSRQKFRQEFALPIERYGDEEATRRLKTLTGPFILRRVKTDPRVIQDLPEKMEMKVYCHLTEEQATLYEAVVQDSLRKVAESEGIERRGLVLSMLMQLKQICNHPVQYLHQGNGSGPDTTALAGRSGKLERLTEMLDEVNSVGDRVLIFTQFAEMGHLLRAYLPQALGCAVQFLHGGVPASKRDQMIKRFQEEEHGPPIFILSLKAGGTGLNLTRANHVFHFDRWWNPAVENQATDRAFRIGQRRNVQVHKFVTVGTMEEMIDDMIESKKALAEAVVGKGEQWLTELSTDDLRELVRLRKQ